MGSQKCSQVPRLLRVGLDRERLHQGKVQKPRSGENDTVVQGRSSHYTLKELTSSGVLVATFHCPCIENDQILDAPRRGTSPF